MPSSHGHGSSSAYPPNSSSRSRIVAASFTEDSNAHRLQGNGAPSQQSRVQPSPHSTYHTSRETPSHRRSSSSSNSSAPRCLIHPNGCNGEHLQPELTRNHPEQSAYAKLTYQPHKGYHYLPGQIAPAPNTDLGSTSTPTPLANVPVHERTPREQGERVYRRRSRDIIMERQRYREEREQQQQRSQQPYQPSQPPQYQQHYSSQPASSQHHGSYLDHPLAEDEQRRDAAHTADAAAEQTASFLPSSLLAAAAGAAMPNVAPPSAANATYDNEKRGYGNTSFGEPLYRSNSTDSTRLGHNDEKAALRAAAANNSSGSDSQVNSNKKKDSSSDGDNPDRDSAQISMDSKEQPETYRATLKDLFRYATFWNHFFNSIGITCACVAGASQPLMTIVFGNLTTSFLNYQASLVQSPEAQATAKAELQSKVNEDALLLVYIGIAMFAATYIYMATWVYSGEEITRRIRERYLAAILRQEIAYFDSLGAGEVTTRISSDIQLIQEGISDKIPMSVMFLATFVSGFVVAYVRSWKLALSMTSIVPCVMISGSVMNVFIAKLQQLELDHVAHGATLAEEAFGTVRTAKAFGIEHRLVELYDEDNKRSTQTGFRKAIISGIGLGTFFFIIYSGYALAFYFGSKLIADGEIASGIVMNVIFSIFIGAFSMALLAPNMQALSYALGAGGKIFETIDREPAIDSSSNEGLEPQFCEGTLHLHRVDFSYPGRRDVQVLTDFSLHIPKGKVTALVGASGSGKSTIVQLVERFYDPDAGAVLLDGVDLRNLNLKWLRTQIGLVSQEPTLFSTSIRENIEHGLTNSQYASLPDDERLDLVIQAAKMANAHDFIQQLPEGYDTMVGDRAILLSGGQKQRIAIARAIVKNPRILLLDEATSALDTASEGVVTEALDKASKGRTTITIAHRLSTIKNADKIVVMGKGRIVEQGTHDSLLANPNSAYSSLVSAQRIQANTETQHIYDDEDEVVITAAKEKAARRQSLTSRASSRLSLSSLILRQRREDDDEAEGKEERLGVYYLFYRLVKINREYLWTLYVPGVVCAFACGAVYPAFAILFGRALENFSKCSQPVGTQCPEPFRGDMRHNANLNALWFFIISIVATVAVAVQTHNLMAASSILSERLRKMLYRAYLRADIAFFDDESHSSGALTNNLADFAQKIQGLVGVTLGTIIQSFATLVVGFIIAIAYGWKLSLVVIACTPLTLSAGFVRLKLVVLKDVKIKKAHEGAAQRACEAANSIRTVASLTREDACLAIYKEELKEPGRVIRNTAFVSNILYSISQALAFPVIALAFWYGSRLLLNGEYSSGSFFTILTSVVFGSIQAGNVFNFVPDMSNARSATEASLKMIDSVPDIDAEAMGGIVLNNCRGHIRFENVHFRYPTRTYQKVLRGLSLEIKPGSFNAIVGASGCGKSTMIQLIERFYDPLAGSVEIDGHNLTDLNLSAMRKHIALVSQEPTLYHGSIGFNIRLGAVDPDSVTLEQMRAACAQSNILEFIETLPDGFDTEVGGRATSQLSGGQKQRIAIARALIRNPKILLLDEATSALDSTSERVVQDALDKAARGRTTIAIAHRLSSISKADRIFVLKDGVVAESGTHSALMRLGGIYAQLVSLQTLQNEDA